jgi:hypothetical protein
MASQSEGEQSQAMAIETALGSKSKTFYLDRLGMATNRYKKNGLAVSSAAGKVQLTRR